MIGLYILEGVAARAGVIGSIPRILSSDYRSFSERTEEQVAGFFLLVTAPTGYLPPNSGLQLVLFFYRFLPQDQLPGEAPQTSELSDVDEQQ